MNLIATVSVTLLALLLILPLHAQTVDPKLLEQCQRGDGKSCAYAGALLFKTDPSSAKSYYEKACLNGHTSSCVFSSDSARYDKHLEDVAKQAQAKDVSDLDSWYEKNLRHYAHCVLVCQSSPLPNAFSMSGCGQQTLWKVNSAAAQRDGEVSRYAFGSGCDLDGTSTFVKTDNRNYQFFLNVSVKNMGEAHRMTATRRIRAKRVEDESRHVYFDRNLDDGILYDRSNRVLARFLVRGSLYVDLGNPDKIVRPLRMSGSVTIKEFRGKPVNRTYQLQLAAADALLKF